MATIRDIAEAADVTISTVSKALNNEPGVSEQTRTRIRQIAEQFGYKRAAKTTTDASPRIIGLIWPQANGLTFAHTINAIRREAEKRNYSVVVSTALAEHAFLTMKQLSIAHCIYWMSPSWIPTEDFLLQCQSYEGTLVVVGGSLPVHSHQVAMHREHAIEQAVRHLAGLGHETIGFIGIKNEKLIGYTVGLLGCQLPYRPELVIQSSIYRPFPDEQLSAILHGDPATRATAVIIESQGTLRRFARYAKRYGVRIPEDVSVVAYDHIPEMEEMLEVPVTTVGPNIEELAKEAVELALMPKTGGDGSGKTVPIAMELIARSSSGSPSKS